MAEDAAAAGDLIERTGARVLVVDAQERVLLLLGADPGAPEAGEWWFTPGGGVDAGESARQGAIRELAEETGLVLVELGPAVWVRTAEFVFLGERYRQAETFFLARVGSHQIDLSGITELERRVIHGFKWWSLDELDATTDRVYPSRLAEEMRLLLRDGIPDEPRDVGP